MAPLTSTQVHCIVSRARPNLPMETKFPLEFWLGTSAPSGNGTGPLPTELEAFVMCISFQIDTRSVDGTSQDRLGPQSRGL